MPTKTVARSAPSASPEYLRLGQAGVDLAWLDASLARPRVIGLVDVEDAAARLAPWLSMDAPDRLLETVVLDSAPWLRTRLTVVGMGTREGRAFSVAVSPGTVAVRVVDPARAERVRERQRVAAEKQTDLRARLLAEGDEEGLAALDRPGVGVIREWSAKSRARMARTIAEVDVSPILRDGCVPGLITLTLPGVWEDLAPDGATFKRLVSTFRRAWRDAFGWSLVGIWKLEFQRRGAPHLHLLAPVPALGPGGVRFELWLSQVWARVVGSTGQRRLDHLAAGTGVDFGAITMVDPRRIAAYFMKHSAKTGDGKEYQHVVPALWQEPGKGPGRFWGIWGLERATREVQVSWEQYVVLRRRLRGIARARAWKVAAARARYAGQDPLSVRPRRVRGLGAAGGLAGGWVMVNDGPAVWLAVIRSLTL
jgi:hypothetical protein